jgi:YHS domain-containing protein
VDRDPVCGTIVGRDDAAEKSEYQGRAYYFCSADCKERFDRNPLPYTVRRISEA